VATICVLGTRGTSALIFKCNRVFYERGHTFFYASDERAHWSTGFGFDDPVVINGNPELRQAEYDFLTFPGYVPFQVLSGRVTIRNMEG